MLALKLNHRPLFALTLALMLALFGGGCARVEWDSFRMPDFKNIARLPSMAAPVKVGEQQAVRPEELVDAQGQCASEPLAAATPAPEQTPGAEGAIADPVTVSPNSALSSAGIGLGMTECDVVKRAGPPEKLELGSTERSERKLTLTYIRNMRPGIYTFVAGRLVTVERAPEPPAPAKPVKPAKPAKPKNRSAAT